MPAPVQTDDRFSRMFKEAGAHYAAGAVEQLGVYERHQPVGGAWSLSDETSLLRVGEVTVHQSPLGSLGYDGSWLWAWVNERTHPPGSPRLSLANWLREFGERNQIHEFVTPRLELADFPDPELAARRHGFETHEASDGRHVYGERDGRTMAVRFTEDDLVAAVSYGTRPGTPSPEVRREQN
ncbi:DUF6882 domain-containing protein [Streptomyces sp. NPDC057137]|uniref:DUF6882 domain-containing protein n=1 Tax=Streptomyces sp. NPDC057137 TaxID=3346030 RepID=UPI00363A493F